MSFYRRELLVNVSFLILANLLIKPYYIFFVERNIQNQVGTEAWGIYFTLFSLSMLPQIILDMGITSFANQRLSAHRDELKNIWKNTLWIKPILALIFMLALFIVALLGGYIQKYPKIIAWIGANQILLSGILFFRAYISGLGYYRMDSFMSVADKLIFILLFGLAVVWGKVSSIEHYLWLQTVSMVIPFFFALTWIFRKAGFVFPNIDFPNARKIIVASLPFAGVFILMVLFCRMEPVWIDALRTDGAQQSGIYAAAYRLLDAANMMGFLFAGILLPMFSHALGQRNFQEYQDLFDLAWRLMVSIAIILSCTIASQHRYIMQMLYLDDHPDILHIVIINLIPLTINYLLSTLITASGKARTMNYYFLGSILINFICHWTLTPQWGAKGAAFAALITQVSTSLLLLFMIEKHKLVKITLNHSKSVFGSMTIMLLLIWVFNLTEAGPLYKMIFLFVTATMVFTLFGIIPAKSILTLLRRK